MQYLRLDIASYSQSTSYLVHAVVGKRICKEKRRLCTDGDAHKQSLDSSSQRPSRSPALDRRDEAGCAVIYLCIAQLSDAEVRQAGVEVKRIQLSLYRCGVLTWDDMGRTADRLTNTARSIEAIAIDVIRLTLLT